MRNVPECSRTGHPGSITMYGKVSLPTPACGEGKFNVYCRAPRQVSPGQLVLKAPKLPGRDLAKMQNPGEGGKLLWAGRLLVHSNYDLTVK